MTTTTLEKIINSTRIGYTENDTKKLGKRLITAAKNGEVEVAQYLVRLTSSKISQEDLNRAFIEACSNGHSMIVEDLLNFEVDVNACSGLALKNAIKNKYTDIINLLIYHKAHIYVDNSLILQYKDGLLEIINV
jgi:ankyrin repeat protein